MAENPKVLRVAELLLAVVEIVGVSATKGSSYDFSPNASCAKDS